MSLESQDAVAEGGGRELGGEDAQGDGHLHGRASHGRTHVYEGDELAQIHSGLGSGGRALSEDLDVLELLCFGELGADVFAQAVPLGVEHVVLGRGHFAPGRLDFGDNLVGLECLALELVRLGGSEHRAQRLARGNAVLILGEAIARVLVGSCDVALDVLVEECLAVAVHRERGHSPPLNLCKAVRGHERLRRLEGAVELGHALAVERARRLFLGGGEHGHGHALRKARKVLVLAGRPLGCQAERGSPPLGQRLLELGGVLLDLGHIQRDYAPRECVRCGLVLFRGHAVQRFCEKEPVLEVTIVGDELHECLNRAGIEAVEPEEHEQEEFFLTLAIPTGGTRLESHDAEVHEHVNVPRLCMRGVHRSHELIEAVIREAAHELEEEGDAGVANAFARVLGCAILAEEFVLCLRVLGTLALVHGGDEGGHYIASWGTRRLSVEARDKSRTSLQHGSLPHACGTRSTHMGTFGSVYYFRKRISHYKLTHAVLGW
mmetsp:Transcript_526/g.1409  ORF Transcript_526/g.1409 Transcript_526/m.1409 type:complete len:491 (-) Transcript_526:122-1594(-)